MRQCLTKQFLIMKVISDHFLKFFNICHFFPLSEIKESATGLLSYLCLVFVHCSFDLFYRISYRNNLFCLLVWNLNIKFFL